MKNEKLVIDITDRTFKFGVRVVRMANALPKNPAGYAMANQIVRSGTSVGANIEEAQAAFSKRDFIYSMQVALKEARETRYWIRMVTAASLLKESLTAGLLAESEEIVKILTAIVKNAKKKS